MLPKNFRLLRRAEFVQASRTARRIASPCFLLQSVPASAPDLSPRSRAKSRLESHPESCGRTPDKISNEISLGITASRKVGNAVARNRAKRRLRALLHRVVIRDRHPLPSRRIVLIARKTCLTADFSTMRSDLERTLTLLETGIKSPLRRNKAQDKAQNKAQDS